jgi:AhpD family alkylhydroperoxidase
MTQRLSIQDVDPGAYQAVFPLQKYASSGRLGAALVSVVDIRASQINHCAWCLDMHTAEARGAGVEQRKIDLIAAWREAPGLFSEREQAALALTEQVTLISQDGVSDEVWERAAGAFDEQETVQLLMAIAVINVWNRMNVAARTELPQQPPAPG